LPENSILITANMQSETGFPSSHQLKSYVPYKSRLKLAARAVLSADAGLLVRLDVGIFLLVCRIEVFVLKRFVPSRMSFFCSVNAIYRLVNNLFESLVVAI